MIITSADGHAVVPPSRWAEYLEPKFHRYLDALEEDREVFGNVGALGNVRVDETQQKIFDKNGVYNAGQAGVWNHDVRLGELDREGIAAELLFPGDFRSIDLFWNTVNATYPTPAMDAGARAWNRWAVDEFGRSRDRFLLVGATLSGLDRQAVLDEAEFMADEGFTGVWAPGTCVVPGQIPVYESYWDPVFASYAEKGIVQVCHAGYGIPQGYMHSEVASAVVKVRKAGGGEADLMHELLTGVFNDHGVFADLRSRAVTWLFTLGGILDRHPKLKIMLTEIRADWLPAALGMIDAYWEKNRSHLPCRKPPSEYMGEQIMMGLSFMKRCEADHRDEIGVKAMAFGRDYPHHESTWPNTVELIGGLCKGMSEAEGRAIMGENMMNFLGLDHAHLRAIADRINAPTWEQIRDAAPMSPELIKHLTLRCGYSEPWEGDRRTGQLEAMLKIDLPRMISAATAFEPA